MKNLLLPIFCLSAILSSCKKETVEGPQGPQGPAGPGGSAPSGTLAGKAKQYDEFGVEYTSGLNTTTVSVDGTNMSAVTDASGNYSIPNVPPGVYNLSFTKPGAGLYKATQVTFPGNGVLYNTASVVDKATTIISTAMVKDTMFFSTPQIKFQLTCPPISKSRAFMLVFGKTANIDLAVPSSYNAIYVINLSSGSTGINSTTNISGSNYNAFSSGSAIYVKVYPIATSYSGYYDAAIDENVYTTYGTPFPTTFTVTKP